LTDGRKPAAAYRTNVMNLRKAAGSRPRARDQESDMKQYLTMGLAVLAGAALIETALIPGLLIGGAAVLAPKALPNLRRRLRPLVDPASRQRSKPGASASARPASAAPRHAAAPLPELGLKQAIGKTITFRVIVTALDFTSNYVVLGEFTTAAGLSTFALVAGPVLYLAHETAWNYLGPPEGEDVDVSALWRRGGAAQTRGFTVSRAIAKTVTFRTIATAVDFTTLYVVVGDALTAAGLAAWGFAVGPFVYWGHEKAWEYFTAPKEGAVEILEPIKLLPAPARA
jgi:uncharacterized membrane protein